MRIKYLDIAKGLGITLIVWAHSRGFFAGQFLVLCIGLFFLISGFLHKSNTNFKEFITRKFYRLYVPFICCNLFLPTLTLLKRLSLNLEIKNNVIYIAKIFLLLEKDGFLFGATWFLGSLFLISVTIKALETLFKKDNKYLFIGLLIVFFIFLSNQFGVDPGIRRTITGALFYYTGIILNRNIQQIKEFTLKSKYLNIIPLIILLVFWNKIPSFDYKDYNTLSIIPTIIYTISFYIFIILVSKFLETRLYKLGNLFAFIGKYSLHILIWHFVFIELVSAFILKINGIPIFVIERLPHVVCESVFCVFLYFILGLFGPLLLSVFYTKIFSYLKH